MKESVGGTQIMILVVLMVLIFAGLMSFTINHSNAFATKDQIVQVLESHGGLDLSNELTPGEAYYNSDETIQAIVDIIDATSYRQSGPCPDSSDGYEVAAYQRNGAKTSGNDKASFCIVKIPTEGKSGAVTAYYYQVIVFYSLDIPVLKALFNFRAVGETKVLYS